MDSTLNEALQHLLDEIDEVVQDLLLIEVDWGQHTPFVDDTVTEVGFQGANWPLVYTDSELVLRRALCRASAKGRAILVFPSDNGFALPLDIRARAHGGTVCRLGLRYRLWALTNRGWPPEVDYVEWRPSIERHFDALVRSTVGKVLGWDVTRSDLESKLVQVAFGLEVKGRDAPQLLADLVSAQRGETEPPTDLELSLLRGQLRLHQVPWSNVLVWAAEEAGRAKELVRIGVMMGAEREARRMPNWGGLNKLRVMLVSDQKLAEQDAVSAVVDLSTGALSQLHPSTRQLIAKEAERALKDLLPEGSYNPWFPSALEYECQAIARRLASREADAEARLARLHEHLFAAQASHDLSVLDHMVDLVSQWEVHSHPDGAFETVAEWAGWYAEHGSRMDLSALKLMHLLQQGSALTGPAEVLLARYWAWRSERNGAFARQFLSLYEPALHDRQSVVFGTHRILDWVVRPRLQDGRSVFLVVIDGMGYASFHYLLEQWAEEVPAVRTRESVETAAELPRAVLSLLPSVTSVSRKGLFLNALPTDRLDDEEAYEEKARVKEAESLQAALPAFRTKLYNKTNLSSGQELLDDLQFRGADLVAVVLNAIDDDVKSTTTGVRLAELGDLGPLRRAVHAALTAGWDVIVTADHGHTWHRDKGLRRGPISPGGGERFAPVASTEKLPEDAVVTRDRNIVARVQEADQMALLTSVGTYFGQVPRRGRHGGAGLEEVVIPCAFLTHEAPAAKRERKTAAQDEDGERAAAADYDLSGVILTLADGRLINLDLPFTLSPREVRLLQALARLGRASEAELKQALGTRRVAGPLAALRDRLAAAGYDYIEQEGAGAGGAVYRFRAELLD